MRTPRITDRRWRRFRNMIMVRDGGTCRYRYPGCTLRATQVDHLVPREKEPARMFDETNCYAVCHSCHREKERRTRAGDEVVFLAESRPEMRPNRQTYTRKSERSRANLPIGGDYSRTEAYDGDERGIVRLRGSAR